MGKQYPIDEALALLLELSTVKFKESVDVSVNLGIDARKSDQAVRGATVLPNGTGKTVRVAEQLNLAHCQVPAVSDGHRLLPDNVKTITLALHGEGKK